MLSYYDNALKFVKNGNMTLKMIIGGAIDLFMEGRKNDKGRRMHCYDLHLCDKLLL